MTELGTRLKEAREAKGYSLEKLQEITKIQKRYLVGIEEGNYSIMPGSFYVRAFIKQYAEAVGLNPEELLEQFKQDVPGSQAEEVAQSFTKSPSRRKLKARSNSKLMEAMPKIIVALFIVAILIFSVTLILKKASEKPLVQKEEDLQLELEQRPTPTPTEEEKAAAKEEEEAEAAEEEKEEEEEPEVKQTISEGAVSGQDTVYEISGTDTLNIRVEVSGNTWVGIRNEAQAEQVEARAYQAGETVTHDSTENGYARIRLGDSTFAKVFVNDEEVTYAQQAVTQNIILKLVKEEQEEQ